MVRCWAVNNLSKLGGQQLNEKEIFGRSKAPFLSLFPKNELLGSG